MGDVGFTLWDISTHALREEGDSFTFDLLSFCLISTHALREEGDRCRPSSRYKRC